MAVKKKVLLSHTIAVFLWGEGGGFSLCAEPHICQCKPKAYIGLSRNVEFYQLCTHRSLLHWPRVSLTFFPAYWFGGKGRQKLQCNILL